MSVKTRAELEALIDAVTAEITIAAVTPARVGAILTDLLDSVALAAEPISARMKIAAVADPGIPPGGYMYFWLDSVSGLIKARVPNETVYTMISLS